MTISLENISCAVETNIPLCKLSMDKSHHFLVMLKPEIFVAESIDIVSKRITVIADILSDNGVEVVNHRILTGNQLEMESIISKQYPILNLISKDPLTHCSHYVIREIREQYGSSLPLLGAYQFIAETGMSALDLCKLNDRLGAKKFGSGKYLLDLRSSGFDSLVFNAFHPYQVEWFTLARNTVVALLCQTDISTDAMRNKVVGTIFPDRAVIGSIRRTLYDNKDALKLKALNVAFNGVHVSPSPLEAMYQIALYFGDVPLPIKNHLNKLNLSKHMIDGLPYQVVFDKATNAENSIFDLCENKDLDKNLDILHTLVN